MKSFWKGFSCMMGIGIRVLLIMAVTFGLFWVLIQGANVVLALVGDFWGAVILCFGAIFFMALGTGLALFWKEKKALKELERAELWLGVCTTEWEHITNDPKCSKAKADEVYHKVQAAKIQRRKCLERLEEIRNYF